MCRNVIEAGSRHVHLAGPILATRLLRWTHASAGATSRLLDAAQYRSKWEHLQERRREVLAAMESAESPVPLDGILNAWNQGDAQARRGLLLALFEGLDVRDGEIVGYRARADKEDEVGALLDPDPERLFRVMAGTHIPCC